MVNFNREETKEDEIINISKYKKKIVLFLSGMLNVGLKNKPKEKSHNLDSKIIAENIFDYLNNKNKTNKINFKLFLEEFIKWFSKENQEKKVISSKDNLEESKESGSQSSMSENKINESVSTEISKNLNSESENLKLSNLIFSKLTNLQNNMTIPQISPDLLLNIFKNFSLVGQINKSQFISAINEIFIYLDSQGVQLSESDKNYKISHLLNLINFDSKESDLVDISDILIPLILILEVSVEEKINFIYQIFEEEREELYLHDIKYFLEKIFSFIIKSNFDSNNKEFSYLEDKLPILISQYLSEDIFNYFNINIKSQNKKGISAKQLIEYYYNLN
jgi:hypothetical protein